jgi:hypothetical protein
MSDRPAQEVLLQLQLQGVLRFVCLELTCPPAVGGGGGPAPPGAPGEHSSGAHRSASSFGGSTAGGVTAAHRTWQSGDHDAEQPIRREVTPLPRIAAVHGVTDDDQ